MEGNVMKVLYVGGFELPDKNAAAQRVFANAKLLRDAGCQVTFVGVDKTLRKGISFEETQFIYEGFTCYSVRYPSSSTEWFRYISSVSYLKHIETTAFPDMIIAYNYPAPALYKLKRWCKKHNVKLVSDCTEWYAPRGKGLYRMAKWLDTYVRMKFLHPRLDGMIAVSQYLYQYYNKRMDHVYMLPPLVDKEQEKWSFNSREIRNNNVRQLIYAGSPEGGKDRIDIMIKALSAIRKHCSLDIRLLVIGISREQYVTMYDATFPMEDSFVEFKGRIPHEEAIRYVHDADFQIFIRENNLTNRAGFPSKFVESMSCGTPVITNRMNNLDAYLKNGVNGFFVDYDNIESLTNTLSAPLNISRKEIEQLRSNCEKLYFFNYRVYVDSLGEFLKLRVCG